MVVSDAEFNTRTDSLNKAQTDMDTLNALVDNTVSSGNGNPIESAAFDFTSVMILDQAMGVDYSTESGSVWFDDVWDAIEAEYDLNTHECLNSVYLNQFS